MSHDRAIAIAIAIALALAAGGVLAGCGGAGLTPAQEARGAVRTFLVACARDQPDVALETISEGARRRFLDAAPPTLARCQAVVALGVRPGAAAALERAQILPAPDAGDRTRVPVRVAGRLVSVEVEQAPNGWRIAQKG